MTCVIRSGGLAVLRGLLRWCLLLFRHRLLVRLSLGDGGTYRAHCRGECFCGRFDSCSVCATTSRLGGFFFFLYVLFDVFAHFVAVFAECFLRGAYDRGGGTGGVHVLAGFC